MRIVFIACVSFLLDLLLGDPAWMPHPVVGMGRCIAWAEPRLRRRFPDSPEGRRRAGLVLAVLLPAAVLLVAAAVTGACGRIHPVLGLAAQVLWGWQSLALCGLRREVLDVCEKLTRGTLEEARAAVGRVVGRDTAGLTREGVVRAAVETAAENYSDGFLAPLLYLLIGGAPLALCYKAVNTMDSMIGYKNEAYLDFGRAAARLDDAANYVPSRLSALILIAAAPLCGLDGEGARRIWRRDRRKHASPNSAQTESVMAGALGIRLGGPASYFGEFHDKPYIGDDLREPEAEDIRRACGMISRGGVLGLAALCALRLLAGIVL